MNESKSTELSEEPDDLYEYVEDEDEQATWDAINAGLRDAEAGRVVPIEEVRKLIPQWIAKYTSQKPR